MRTTKRAPVTLQPRFEPRPDRTEAHRAPARSESRAPSPPRASRAPAPAVLHEPSARPRRAPALPFPGARLSTEAIERLLCEAEASGSGSALRAEVERVFLLAHYGRRAEELFHRYFADAPPLNGDE